MKTLKTAVCLFVLALSVSLFTGCRTAHGFGQDVEATGESIQRGTN
jgi:predicted small secreted protein